MLGEEGGLHHAAGWDALTTDRVASQPYRHEAIFGASPAVSRCLSLANLWMVKRTASTGQRTRVVHLRQVIGRIRWWRRVHAE